jgi:mRNA interferase HigB
LAQSGGYEGIVPEAGRVVFNIKGNDYRLVAAVQYRAGALAIRFFGSHAEYDEIDAETV